MAAAPEVASAETGAVTLQDSPVGVATSSSYEGRVRTGFAHGRLYAFSNAFAAAES